MITLEEIEEAIRKEENAPHTYDTCRRLASLYILRDYMGGGGFAGGYSRNAGDSERIGRYGDSEFLELIEGRSPAGVWAVLDELMETIMITNRRLYDGVMRRLDAVT